jgi:heme/copper-type cytochrome/quinol oxidase subunit 2
VNFSDAERAEWHWLDQLLDSVMFASSWTLIALLAYGVWVMNRRENVDPRGMTRQELLVALAYGTVSVLGCLVVPALHVAHTL